MLPLSRLIAALLIVGLPTATHALTPEELRAQIDAQTSQSDPFRTLLNDPDPARSAAAVRLMIESGEARLMDMAIDFGLRSPMPQVRRMAVEGFLATRPTLQVRLTVAEADAEAFDTPFRDATGGSVAPDGSAIYSVNVGAFDAEKNCYLRTGLNECGVEVGPSGLVVRKGRSVYTAESFLSYSPEGPLIGSTAVRDVDGGVPTTLSLTD